VKRALLAVVCCLLLVAIDGQAARASLSTAQRGVLQRYLNALEHGRFDTAFALLSDDERRYFGSPANLASVYAADRLKIDSFVIVESKNAPLGTLAIVSEHVEFFDHAHQSPAAVTAKVPYGIVKGPHGQFRIADRLHPWRAFAPADASASQDEVRIIIRKVSFFTGRVELVATFQNLGEATVTILPYLRTVVRDDAGRVYHPIESRLPGFTDRTLFTGLRLVPGSQYTGLMTFSTPNRFAPKSLSASFAPALLDGADAPFSIDLPAFSLPG